LQAVPGLEELAEEDAEQQVAGHGEDVGQQRQAGGGDHRPDQQADQERQRTEADQPPGRPWFGVEPARSRETGPDRAGADRERAGAVDLGGEVEEIHGRCCTAGERQQPPLFDHQSSDRRLPARY
jgi:hypothetical protein